MTLAPGTRIGPYQVVNLVGAGGMGEVYQAHDSRLDRSVAIKILPEAFARDPERLARFEREAKTLASLNHPNIAVVHGFEVAHGIQALVMELVEGPTLADRIRQGPIPLDEALPIARQVADALEAAHERGIIHRDLKPANIKVRNDGTAKVLDFGLAKVLEPISGVGADASPTITSPALTRMGVILGTAAYMSPEQAKGKSADQRSDIFAFGCVLYEMLAGRRAFERTGFNETTARILDLDPDWTALPASTPVAIRTLLRRCLQKDPQKRLRAIGDARLELDDAELRSGTQGMSSGGQPGRFRMAWISAALIIGAVLGAGGLALLRPRSTVGLADSLEFPVAPPQGSRFSGAFSTFAVSPDGKSIAMVALAENRPAVWIRALRSTAASLLPGTMGAASPFWSPDSKRIAFFADGKLKTVNVNSGASSDVCNATMGIGGEAGGGGAWNLNDVILFRSQAGPLQKVPATGGTPSAVTALKGTETSHQWPWFLPDGQHFLFHARGKSSDQLYVGSLTSTDTMPIGSIRSSAVYASGYILFANGGLMAQPFDLRSKRLQGEPFSLSPKLRVRWERGAFSASQNGLLAYLAGEAGGSAQLTWMDRTGKPLGTVSEPGWYPNFSLSPDDRRVAASLEASDGNIDIWMIDLDRMGDKVLITSDPAFEFDPAWSRDGKHIAFNSNRQGVQQLFRRPSDGSGGAEALFEGAVGTLIAAPNWSPDGDFVIFSYRGDLWIKPLANAAAARPLRETPFDESTPAFSPEGDFVVYASNYTGRPEIYVRPFPAYDREHKISREGGRSPRWRRNDEIVFVSLDGSMMTARVSVGTSFQSMIPQRLFPAGLEQVTDTHPYDVSKDGKRFLIRVSPDPPGSKPVTVVTNWPARLDK